MGQKASKRKMKGKGPTTSSQTLDFDAMEEAMRIDSAAKEKMAKAKMMENMTEWYDILMKDTSTMSET